ncbi:MAG: leucine-rich repeat domain-containing protein [Sedimentisphaerales bacterium]
MKKREKKEQIFTIESEKVKNLIISLIICILVNVGIVEGEENVHFASSKLEKIICKKLGVEPPVNKTKMLELTYLVVRHEGEESTGIDNLAGIEYATNLKKLFLYDNPIRDLSPLSKLTNLEGMQLNGKYIEDVSPLASMTKLEWLDLYETQVSDISPLIKLINLDHLSLSSNKISDVSPLSELVKITGLTFNYNQVHDISALSVLKNLESLTIHHNHISDVSAITGLSSLRDLDISYNQISDISPLVHLQNLEMLKINDNPLSKEAYKVHFPKMLKENPDLYVMADHIIKPRISKTHLKFYLGTSITLSLFGLLVILFSKKTVLGKLNNISGNLEVKNDTNLLRRISTSALESLGFAVSALILVAICIFIRYAVDVFPVGQMGGMSLVVQASLILFSALGSCVAALVIGKSSLSEIKRSNGLLIGNKQAYCGVFLSLMALVLCVISFIYLR